MDNDNIDTWRPVLFEDFIGQTALKAELRVHLSATESTEHDEGSPFPHTILYGPPGSGKSSLVGVIDGERTEGVHFAMCPLSLDDLVELVDDAYGILFLDELHNLTKAVQNSMLSLLESGYIKDRRGRRIEPQPDNMFCVIAATTERQTIIKPLWDRFILKPKFDPYTDEEIALIAAGMAHKAGLQLAPDVLAGIGRAAAGVPREARNLIKAAQALTAHHGRDVTLAEILTMTRIDEDGLSADHRDYLAALARFGGTAGLDMLSTYLRYSSVTVLEIERSLFDRGLVELGPKGRELTGAGRRRARGETRPQQRC